MEDFITRSEFERQIARLREEMMQRQTDAMKALRAELDPGSIHSRLDNHAELMREQERTLTLIYNDVGHMKTDIGTLKTDVSKIEKRLDTIETTMATKEDLAPFATKAELAALKTGQDAHFDQLEAEQKTQHEMLRQILRLLGQNPSE